jgi:hypothetical protein
MKTIALSLAASLALGGAALAADAETLRLYAALAKLEANKAEAAGAVLLAAMPNHSDEAFEEAVEDFESDSAQIAAYVDAILDMDVTDEQRAAVEQFGAGWAEAAEAARPLLSGYEDSESYRSRVFDWWESLDGLDDAVDDMLEDILEAEGIAFEDDD